MHDHGLGLRTLHLLLHFGINDDQCKLYTRYITYLSFSDRTCDCRSAECSIGLDPTHSRINPCVSVSGLVQTPLYATDPGPTQAP